MSHKHSAKESAAVFAIGAIGYPLLELLWRKRTHPSMALAGGVCFLAIYRVHAQKRPLLSRCVRGALAVTGVELFTGLLVNRLLRLGVWDYSRRRFALFGQICASYSALWFLICALASPLCAKLRLYFSHGYDYNKA